MGMRRGTSIWPPALAMSVAALAMGGWAFLWPGGFYHDFPYPGASWVSTLGPFDEHLMVDFGSALIGLGLIVLIAAWKRSVQALRVAMAGYVAFGALHFAYHLGTLEAFGAASAAAQATALLTLVVVPALVLYATRTRGEES